MSLLIDLLSALGGAVFNLLGLLEPFALQVVLWLTGRWDDAVRLWGTPEQQAFLLDPRYHMFPLQLTLVIMGFILLPWFRSLGRPRQRRGGMGQQDRPLRIRRQPWHRRFYLWHVHLFDQPWLWCVGEIIAYLNQTHALAVGGSGSGKSTAVVSILLQPIPWPWWTPKGAFMRIMFKIGKWQRRSVVVFSFDRTDPIEEATNVAEDMGVPVTRFRVREDHGWDLLACENEDIDLLAEAVPEAWSKTGDDTGHFRSLVSEGLSVAMHQWDDLYPGTPRDWDAIVDAVDAHMNADPDCPNLARLTWVKRLRTLKRIMGPSLGSDFDIVSVLKQRGSILHLSGNSYTSQATTPLLAVMGIVQAKLASEQISDVWCVFEEVSFLKNRGGALDDLARSMRARGWRLLWLSQNPQDASDAIQTNFSVALFMGLGPMAQKARQWCADAVRGLPGAFRAEELVLNSTIDALEGYMLCNGKVRDASLAPFIVGPAVHRPAGGYTRSNMRKHGMRPTSQGWAIPTAVPVAAKGTGGGTATQHKAPNHGVVAPPPEWWVKRPAVGWPGATESWAVLSRRDGPAGMLEATDGSGTGAGGIGAGVVKESSQVDEGSMKPDVSLGRPAPRKPSAAIGINAPSWYIPGDKDRERIYGKMRREREMPHINKGCLRWMGGDNGYGRPKAHLTVVAADGTKRKSSPTTYVLVYEWEHGKGSAQPSLDHLCHTMDDSCPGNNACENPECDNPMHPYGEPCQHQLCCETAHHEPVSLPVNQQRNADQQRRYASWLAAFKKRQTARVPARG